MELAASYRSSLRHFTDCGIPGIKTVPYGTHLCHFYSARTELRDALVPYIVAGLQNNERCIWIAADPFPTAEAKAELAQAVPNLDAALHDGRLIVLAAKDWYAKAVRMSVEDMTAFWLREEDRALERGFQGLRATGNVTGNRAGLTLQAWRALMAYESALVKAFEGRRVLTLCSYSSADCGSAEVRDVMCRHHYALERSDGPWYVSEAPLVSGGVTAYPERTH